jgi:hypothetical protein
MGEREVGRVTRAAAFFRWLGTPIRATRALFPFTHDGRQTLIYLMCACSAPVLTFVALRILDVTEANGQWTIFAATARMIGYSLLISVCSFAMFVAFRSLSLGGKDGLLNLTSKETPDTAVQAARAVEHDVVQAATEAVAKVEEKAAETKPAEPLPDYAR